MRNGFRDKRIVVCATCAVHADPKLDVALRELLRLTVAVKKVEGVHFAPESFLKRVPPTKLRLWGERQPSWELFICSSNFICGGGMHRFNGFTLAVLFLYLIGLSGCQDLVPRDTQSLAHSQVSQVGGPWLCSRFWNHLRRCAGPDRDAKAPVKRRC